MKVTTSLAIAACMLVGCAGADSGGTGTEHSGGYGTSGGSNPPSSSSPAPTPSNNNPSSPPPANGGEGSDPGAGNVTPTPPPPATPGYQALLGEVHRIQVGEKSTKYSHTTMVDETTFTYDVDCSGFTNYALQRVAPDVFQNLVTHYGSRPVAEDYVHMIENHAGEGRWTAVSKVTDLVAGDIVTWLEPPTSKSSNTGHVMVVAKTPYLVSGSTDYHVLVIDSTESAHGGSMDIRTGSQTGVGEGIIILHTNSSKAPIGYYWSTDPNSPLQTTTIMLGHLK